MTGSERSAVMKYLATPQITPHGAGAKDQGSRLNCRLRSSRVFLVGVFSFSRRSNRPNGKKPGKLAQLPSRNGTCPVPLASQNRLLNPPTHQVFHGQGT